MRLLVSAVCGAFALFGSLASADVLRVSSTGSVEFVDIQSAVDAALDGDVIVVGQGAYDGFTILGKGLTVVSMLGHQVTVEGRVRILDVPASSVALLSGLLLHGTFTHPQFAQPLPVLEIDGCAGDVRIQDCSIRYAGEYPVCTDYLGVPAAWVSASPSTSFVGSTLVGGRGTENPVWVSCSGLAGGVGLNVRQGSYVALYSSQVTGGAGGQGDIYGGEGAIGVLVEGSFLFAAGCTIRGGAGGWAWDFLGYYPGAGGDGLRADSFAWVAFLDTVFQGGNGGYGVFGQAPSGAPTSGNGTFQSLPGQKRSSSAQQMAVGGDPLPLFLQGSAGDDVHLGIDPAAGFQFWPTVRGTWLLDMPPRRGAVPLASLPSGASHSVDLDMPTVSGGAALLHLQTLHMETAGDANLANARTVIVLDTTPAPGFDCNSNGVMDLVDLIRGTSQDWNFDLIPDECTPVPPRDWYVDAGAPPGGDGSAAAPFTNLAQAFLAGSQGDTILVLPGVYTGPENQNLDFAGRALHVRGVGGPSVCILDGQFSARFFVSTELIPGHLRIEGLTMRHGRAVTGVGSPGGSAMLLEPGPQRLVIHDCRFESSSTLGSGGGAVMMRHGSLQVSGSLFVLCTGGVGGAIRGQDLQQVWIQGSRFLQNTATGSGKDGALSFRDVAGVLLQDCVIAGNSSPSFPSGAVFIQSCLPTTDLRILGCTVVGNRTGSSQGGAFLFLRGQIGAHIRNTIVWSHSNAGFGSISAIGLGGSCSAPPTVSVLASNVEAGLGAVYLQNAFLDWGSWNISADPLFEDPAGPDGNPHTWLDNDLSLSLSSPCIDAGHNDSVPPDIFDLDGDGDTLEPAPFDILGNPRIVDIPGVPNTGPIGPPTVDMGAFERQP